MQSCFAFVCFTFLTVASLAKVSFHMANVIFPVQDPLGPKKQKEYSSQIVLDSLSMCVSLFVSFSGSLFIDFSIGAKYPS